MKYRINWDKLTRKVAKKLVKIKKMLKKIIGVKKVQKFELKKSLIEFTCSIPSNTLHLLCITLAAKEFIFGVWKKIRPFLFNFFFISCKHLLPSLICSMTSHIVITSNFLFFNNSKLYSKTMCFFFAILDSFLFSSMPKVCHFFSFAISKKKPEEQPTSRMLPFFLNMWIISCQVQLI